MIRVGKHKLVVWLVLEAHALESRVGCDGHKSGRVNTTMRRVDPAHSRQRFGGLFDDLEPEE